MNLKAVAIDEKERPRVEFGLARTSSERRGRGKKEKR